MASIADVFFTAYIEDKSLQADVQRIGDQAGQSLGQRMATGLQKNGRALGAFGAAAGLAFSAASESAIVFEDQLRTIQTVVPDIDIDKLGDDIKSLAVETGKTTDDLTAGFYDLVSAGVDADDAINVLRDSAKFATGALGSTAESVDLVTSVMNAYGLQAKDSARITDVFAKAVADGKVTASELGASIANIAPIASSAGVSMEEVSAGFATLTAKGVPAAQAATQMRAAISALLTPNEKLNAIQEETGINFAELAKTEGLSVALEKLRESVGGNAEEFGKALGQIDAYQFALAVTGDNAETFADQIVDTTNSAGLATDQYNIKSQSMAEQAKRTAAFLHNLALDAGAVVAPFGQLLFAANQMAPALRGIISPAKVLGTVFGGLLGKGTATLAGLFQDISLGKRTGLAGAINRAGTFVGRTFSLAVTTATKIADAIVGLFNRLPGSNAVKGAAAKAGGAIAAVFSGALVIANKLGSALSSALNALPGVSAVQSAALASGGKVGTTMGKAAGLAFKAGFVVGLAAIADDINNAIQDATKDVDLLGSVGIETDFNPEAVGWPLGPAQSEWSDWFFNQLPESMRQGAKDAFGIIPREASTAMADLASFPGKLTDDLATGLSDGAPAVEEGAEIMFDGLADAALQAVADARQAGRDAVGAYASALRGGWDSVFSAWDSLKDAMKDPLSRAKRIAQLEGILASKRLAKGLRSNDPLIRADAEALVITIEDELALLKEGAEDRGKKGGKGFADGLVKTRDDAKAAARLVANAAAGVLEGLNLRDEGADAGGEFAKGLQSTINTVARVASALASVVAQYLEFGSPTELGPFSKKGGPAGWARIGADDWVQGWNVDPSSTLRRLAESARNALAAPLAGAALPIAASVGATGVGGGIGGLTINGGIHVSVSSGSNPAETGAAVRQGIADSMADILRSQTARLPTGTRA